MKVNKFIAPQKGPIFANLIPHKFQKKQTLIEIIKKFVKMLPIS